MLAGQVWVEIFPACRFLGEIEYFTISGDVRLGSADPLHDDSVVIFAVLTLSPVNRARNHIQG